MGRIAVETVVACMQNHVKQWGAIPEELAEWFRRIESGASTDIMGFMVAMAAEERRCREAGPPSST